MISLGRILVGRYFPGQSRNLEGLHELVGKERVQQKAEIFRVPSAWGADATLVGHHYVGVSVRVN